MDFMQGRGKVCMTFRHHRYYTSQTDKHMLYRDISFARPPLQILHDRISSSSGDHPDYIFLAIIDLLMLTERWDQRKIPRTEIVSSVPTS
jgi:hypothetical protein